MDTCAATTTAGNPCEAYPLDGKDLCFFHDPDSRDARLAAATRGGRGTTVLAADFNADRHLASLARTIFKAVVTGQLDPRAARAAAPYLRLLHAVGEEPEIKELFYQWREEHYFRAPAVPQPAPATDPDDEEEEFTPA
jgi:hypothetical protein